MTQLSSFRAQTLLIDFAYLQQTCPEGLYLSVSPDDHARWTGLLFIQRGPYEPAVFRFEISFPPSYPDAAPIIVFHSEVFHPLCVPSTIYTFSTGVLDASGTVSASDSERLPPGTFSLQFRFPAWFDRQVGQRSSIGNSDALESPTHSANSNGKALNNTLDTRKTTLAVLEHLKDAFEHEELLDSIPLEAAGNTSAWHAWRSHRGLAHRQTRGRSPTGADSAVPPGSPKNPSEWNWDGVWESRVQESIQMSRSGATLFGNSGRPRFSQIEDERYSEIRKQLHSDMTA